MKISDHWNAENRNNYILYLTSLTCNMKNNNIMEIKTATVTSKGQVCIPNLARSMKGFKEGSKVTILVYKDHIELRPIKQISDGLFSALASEEALGKVWNTKEEDEAWKDL
ncbi:MAG: AbrB/MazE/SpoVT family DNA-binding domain-containing protein [Candidatus Woesearchaeota archaeon]